MGEMKGVEDVGLEATGCFFGSMVGFHRVEELQGPHMRCFLRSLMGRHGKEPCYQAGLVESVESAIGD